MKSREIESVQKNKYENKNKLFLENMENFAQDAIFVCVAQLGIFQLPVLKFWEQILEL